jgi:hypothetical protein
MGNFASTAALLPGRNPVGGPLPANYAGIPATGSSSGANPVLPPTNLPPGAPASNPYAPGSAVPTFGANTGGGYTSTNLAGGGSTTGKPGSSPSNILSGMSPADIKRLHDELGNTFGNGVAAALMSFLQGGAGFNQDAINNLFASLQPGIERSTESLMEQFSTSGNRFGSGAQIGLADYLSQVNMNEGQLETQMYEHSIDNALSTLMGLTKGTETTLANSPSALDSLTSALPMVSSIVGGISDKFGVGGSLGSIMDIIGNMGNH